MSHHCAAPSRCLVIGGGGVAGIAWATGLLFGLEQRGFHLRQRDRLAGTSAGSVVAAQLTSTTPLEELHHRQVHGTVPELAGGLGAMGMLRLSWPFLVHRDVDAARRSIGTFALTKGAERAQARREVIRARLGGAEWNPDRDLRITAINIETGERTVFEADGPATLEEAVAASCAVPGVWHPVTIDGQQYMDGGFPSPANIDLAHGSAQTVIVAPLDRGLRKSRSPENELEALRGEPRNGGPAHHARQEGAECDGQQSPRPAGTRARGRSRARAGAAGAIAPHAHLAATAVATAVREFAPPPPSVQPGTSEDRKSTRLNSSHVAISYA